MKLSDGNRVQPPNASEIEVSTFGPGFGESIAIHLGDGEWAVVDSCLTPREGQPAALAYLQELGVAVETAVKLVMVTHWHDDHIRGIGAVLRACANARFYCSAALRGPEITELVELYGRDLLLDTTGVTEFTQIINELVRRASDKASKDFIAPEFAMADRLLWRRSGNGVPAEIHALSPSSAALGVAQVRLRELSQTPQARRLPALSPNHVSVVMWVKVGGVEVLLGSDLEERGDPGLGWQAIVDSTTRPIGRASAFKVAHHGSKNGDHQEAWDALLQARPVAVVTPFVRGSVSLPEGEVARRICDRSSSASLTAFPLTRKSPRRSPATDRVIRQTVRWIRQVQPVQGQIRLRRNATDVNVTAWTEERFGAAVPLERIASP